MILFISALLALPTPSPGLANSVRKPKVKTSPQIATHIYDRTQRTAASLAWKSVHLLRCEAQNRVSSSLITCSSRKLLKGAYENVGHLTV